jgi:FAD/FMN-containing dehydrogenase
MRIDTKEASNRSTVLGGGHGWLQGQYGLAADQLISARLTLANGTAITVSSYENIELFWALRGAGHNFGIVTSMEYAIYDRTAENENWTLEMFIYKSNKLEEVFGAANKAMDKYREHVNFAHFFMLSNMPGIDDKVSR